MSDGAEVNSADYDQRTPLHLASCEGHLGVVSALIELGANVSCTDRWHCTPLDEARRKGNKECERALEKAGALGSMGRELTNGHHHQRLEQRPSEDALTDTNARISSSMMVEWTDLQVVEKIGSGAFGDIFKCRWRGTMVAAKTIKSGAALRGQLPPPHSLPRVRMPSRIFGTKSSSYIGFVIKCLPDARLFAYGELRGDDLELISARFSM